MNIVGLKSSTEEKSNFSLVMRSGSCSDKGPKQYMEDEFICADILSECVDLREDLPSPAACYGVCLFVLSLIDPIIYLMKWAKSLYKRCNLRDMNEFPITD